MNWTETKHCTPMTDEDVLCKMEDGENPCYLVASYMDGHWMTMDYLTRTYLNIPKESVTKWCHIRD